MKNTDLGFDNDVPKKLLDFILSRPTYDDQLFCFTIAMHQCVIQSLKELINETRGGPKTWENAETAISSLLLRHMLAERALHYA
jgi:hypothetical protein